VTALPDRDALDLDLPGRVREAANDQRARRAAIAQHRAAPFAAKYFDIPAEWRNLLSSILLNSKPAIAALGNNMQLQALAY
jgi:hypothetical protein